MTLIVRYAVSSDCMPDYLLYTYRYYYSEPIIIHETSYLNNKTDIFLQYAGPLYSLPYHI